MNTNPMQKNKSQGLMTASVCVLGLLTLICIIVTGFSVVSRPDLEKFFHKTAPGSHMPDAFTNLNEASPIFCIFFTSSLILALKITASQRYPLFAPLIAGPAFGATGWFITEDLQDPNWYHLIAIVTIGMLVSCLVTAMLIGLHKRNSLESTPS